MTVKGHPEYETELEAVADCADSARAFLTYRDEWIRTAHNQGYSLREIADAAGLSHMGVRKIINRG